MHFRLALGAIAALCLFAGTATAEPAPKGQCNAVVENGRSRIVCDSNLNLGLPQTAAPSREDVTYTVRQKPFAAAPATENFCGVGYKMAPGGCRPVTR
jgi:hypothetical protein